jgi:3'-5' exoribonuclease
MKKNRYISDLSEGERFEDLLMIKSVRKGETRAGKPYLSVIFSDKSGEIGGPIWDRVEQYEKSCAPGAVVNVRAQVQTYRDKLQLKVETISEVDVEGLDYSGFLAASERSSQNMRSELDLLISSITNPFLKTLLDRLFFNSEPGERFQDTPAAKGIHHAYLGGLLEHSLSMAQVATLLAGHYRGIDRDLLVAGALLHDIGKVEELAHEIGVIDYTDVGRLKGHLAIGCDLVGRAAAEIKDFPADLLTHIQHLILSHHGRYEFGSPVVPMTPEALLLSFIDDMDAKMNLIERLRLKLKSGSTQWSDYQRSLERFLLLTPLVHEEGMAGPEDEDNNGAFRQQSLF